MSDTLVLAISQSGTTADTNRTVDVVRARGAAVIGIVNRRQSDLVDKSDGVLYTSDGRDVEMSVASTKAFYAMIAAGFLLAFAIAAELGPDSAPDGIVQHDVLVALRDCRTRCARCSSVGPRSRCGAAPLAVAPFVGSGRQRHQPGRGRGDPDQALRALLQVDLVRHHRRQEAHRPLGRPMIVVCAAGLHGSNADDVGKEIGIYRAHKSAPIVIADEGEERFLAALETLSVPVVHPDLSFVLCTMVGHLFGYESALAIDATGAPAA